MTYDDRELIKITEDGIAITRVYSVSECDDTTGSFFHDFFNYRLYIHTLTDDNPVDDIDRIFVGFVYLCFTNDQDKENIIDFTPPLATQPNFYLPYVKSSSIPALSQKVDDYHKSAMIIQFGSISFLGSDWFYRNKNNFFWHNNNVFVKIGKKGIPYDEFITIFPGKTKKPNWNDDFVTFQIQDRRAGELIQIPEDRFDLTTYPNLDPDYENKIIPILFGTKTNITPVCINTATFKYKISNTSFGSTYDIEDITAVYKDGVLLNEGADWTSDDTNGEFTLLADPGSSVITCDAEGLQCQFNFDTGTKTGDFSENIADILFFILSELNNIDVNDINWTAFKALQIKRTQRLGWYLDEGIKTINFIRILQQSALFHFIPDLDGDYYVQYYDRDIPDNIKWFRNEDYFPNSFELEEDTDSTFKYVVMKWDKDPTTGEWKEEVSSEDATEWKYDERKTLTIETALLNQTETQNILEYFLTLVNAPGNKIMAEVPITAFDIIPSDKGKFSRSITDKDGEFVILDEEIYTILEARKNVDQGKVFLKGLLDSQAAGVPSHADTPHEDSYTDHDDNVYTDQAHDDVAHTDISHSDTPYQNVHTDHDDDYDDHTDVPYSDVPYSDYTDVNGHIDHTDVPHTDVPHLDHDDDYNDHDDNNPPHTDTPHSDTPHTDTPHSDGGHVDETYIDHDDEHINIPHADSEI